MHWFSIGVAVFAALAIMVIGVLYLANPLGVARSFGLPYPEGGASIPWWLRLKGTRDIVSGLIVLAVLAFGTPFILGLVLAIAALIPLGDMTLVLSAKGSTATALSVHGLTALVMIAGAVPLLLGIA